MVHWVTEEGAATPDKIPQGSYIRVVGSIRTQADKKHVMGFGIMDSPTEAERDNHDLQVVFSHLKLKQLNAKLSGGGQMMDNSGLSNSMMGSGMGANMGGGGSTNFSSSFGNKNYDTVYALIKQSQEDQGINISSLLQSVQVGICIFILPTPPPQKKHLEMMIWKDKIYTKWKYSEKIRLKMQ